MGYREELTCRAVRAVVALLRRWAGCVTTHGRVANGNYVAPLNNFSMALPRPALGSLQIRDESDPEGGAVSFLDDVGNNQGVTYALLPDKAAEAHRDPTKRDAIYRSFVHDYALPSLFIPISSRSRIVREEFLDGDQGRSYFAVVVIPEASSLVDAQSGKRSDSVRALLVFDAKRFIYMIHADMVTAFSTINVDSLTDKEIGAARDRVQSLRASMRIL